MATGDKLVTLDEIKEIYKHPLVVTIPTGQWSGSGSDYYISVTASNVTADSILVPTCDRTSEGLLKGSVWCVPASGSFTIHTNAIPAGTVTIMVQFVGVMGEANYQVLADVYSKSQTYSKTEAVAKADIINNLTSTATDQPLSAAQGKALSTAIAQSTANMATSVKKTAIAAGTSCTISFSSDGRRSAVISVVASGSGKYATYIYEGYGKTSARQLVTSITPQGSYFTLTVNDNVQGITITPVEQVIGTYDVGVLMILGNPPTIT